MSWSYELRIYTTQHACMGVKTVADSANLIGTTTSYTTVSINSMQRVNASLKSVVVYHTA